MEPIVGCYSFQDGSVDYVKLEHVIVDLGKALPEHPDWIVVATIDGTFIRQYPTHLDGDHVSTLTHTNATQGRHLMHDLDNGAFRYSITGGSTGLYFVFLLSETHLLGLNYEQVMSMDAIVSAVPHKIAALIQVLGIPG
jgi:hypothetical protein